MAEYDEGFRDGCSETKESIINDSLVSNQAIQELREIFSNPSFSELYQNFKVREWFKNKIDGVVGGY